MPQTFQSPKPSGQTRLSALKSGLMRSCNRGIGVERLRDPPTEWGRQFERASLNYLKRVVNPVKLSSDVILGVDHSHLAHGILRNERFPLRGHPPACGAGAEGEA